MSIDSSPQASAFLRIGIADDLLMGVEFGRVGRENVRVGLFLFELDWHRLEVRVGKMTDIEDSKMLIVAGGADEVWVGGWLKREDRLV
jgi:hypothetical protein